MDELCKVVAGEDDAYAAFQTSPAGVILRLIGAGVPLRQIEQQAQY